MNSPNRGYYEASELDLEAIRALAKRIAKRTSKPSSDGRWYLTGRREDQELKINGKYIGDYWCNYSYWLRVDGAITKSWTSHTDTMYKQEVNEGEEVVLQEEGILLFDFKPRHYSANLPDGKFTHDRDASDELIVHCKGFGMKTLLFGLLVQPVKTIARANEGDAHSQERLGTAYFCGMGMRSDYAKAVEWYQKAAKQGNAEGQFRLGECYQYGCGLAQDLERAKQWFSDAAKQNHVKAQAKLDQDLRW